MRTRQRRLDPETPTRRDKFDAWLHRTYFRSSGIHHFMFRRLRPAGVALGLVFVLATCLGIGHERGSIYQLFSLSLAMMLIGLPSAMFRRARLEADARGAALCDRRASRCATPCGSATSANADWPAPGSPSPRPIRGRRLRSFPSCREPGEEERNKFDRAFAYFRWQWLLLRNRLFSEIPSHDEVKLKPGQQTRVFMEITPLRRGVIRLHDLRVLLPDPFGLFQKCVE